MFENIAIQAVTIIIYTISSTHLVSQISTIHQKNPPDII